MSATRTVSKLAYLLGVSDTTLSNYYKDLSIEEMETDPDAVYLRSLCRVRQTLLKNYRKIDHCIRSLHSMVNIKKDLVVIECRDNKFKNFKDIIDVCEIINYITRSINDILISTLSNIEGIKDDKTLITYFEYPIYDSALLGSHHDYFKDGHLPHGIVCPLSKELGNMQAFSYALLNNDTIATNASLIAPYSKLLKKYQEYTPVEEVNKEMTPFEDIYVDCDNTKIIDLVSFINKIQSHGNNPKVHLFLDNRSNFLWHNFQEIFPHIQAEVISVNRIKALKSVVDMYLSSYVLKELYTNDKKEITIFSSDSDYYGLLQFLQETGKRPDINIIYNKSMICQDYISVLNALPNVRPIVVPPQDQNVRDTCINILTAFSLLRDAGSNWNIDKVCKYISSMLLCNCTHEMINKHFEDISVRPSAEGTIVVTKNFKIISPKEGQHAKVVRAC